MTEEEVKRIDARWKSDMDLKVDRLVRFAEEYENFIRMLMEREAQRQSLRKAVIEKTLSGLVWMAVVGIVSLAWTGVQSHLANMKDFLK